jgi:hypothetical protein
MRINVRSRAARWATVVTGMVAVASPLALAVPQANAAGTGPTAAGLTVIVNKPVATCRNANGGQVPEGSTATKAMTIKAPDGSSVVVHVTVVCGHDGNWHEQ